MSITAGDPPTPLPSEVLGSLDGGRGIAGFVLRPADLDRLPVLYADASEPVTAAVVAPDEDELPGTIAPELIEQLRALGDSYGPLGVAIAAAHLTDPRALIASLGPGRHTHAPEPERPLPAANAWPDDAVTITYGELRALVALHLDTLSRTLGKVAPWDDARRTARAMRDGETPLLLSEVLDR